MFSVSSFPPESADMPHKLSMDRGCQKTPHRDSQTDFLPLKPDALVYIGESNLKLPFLTAWSLFFPLKYTQIF